MDKVVHSETVQYAAVFVQYDLHFAGAHSIVIIIIIIVTAAVCYITDVSVCSSHFGILSNWQQCSVAFSLLLQIFYYFRHTTCNVLRQSVVSICSVTCRQCIKPVVKAHLKQCVHLENFRTWLCYRPLLAAGWHEPGPFNYVYCNLCNTNETDMQCHAPSQNDI